MVMNFVDVFWTEVHHFKRTNGGHASTLKVCHKYADLNPAIAMFNVFHCWIRRNSLEANKIRSGFKFSFFNFFLD